MSDDKTEVEPSRELEWRDYIAIAVAALETVLLPLVILVFILIAVFLVIR